MIVNSHDRPPCSEQLGGSYVAVANDVERVLPMVINNEFDDLPGEIGDLPSEIGNLPSEIQPSAQEESSYRLPVPENAYNPHSNSDLSILLWAIFFWPVGIFMARSAYQQAKLANQPVSGMVSAARAISIILGVLTVLVILSNLLSSCGGVR